MEGHKGTMVWLCLMLFSAIHCEGSSPSRENSHEKAFRELRAKILLFKERQIPTETQADADSIEADQVVEGKNALEILLGTRGADSQEEEDLADHLERVVNPYQDVLPCQDDPNHGQSCSTFLPFCLLLPRTGFFHCRRTCQMCQEHRPRWQVLQANFSNHGSVKLLQESPDSSIFMVACFKPQGDMFQSNDSKKSFPIMIHTDADMSDDGLCSELGPILDPLQNCSNRASKCDGDLGNLTFATHSPNIWPQEIPQCERSELTSYRVFNYKSFDLFGPLSPQYRPLVIHQKKSNATISFCARLFPFEQATLSKYSSGIPDEKVKENVQDLDEEALDFEEWKSHWLVRKNGSSTSSRKEVENQPVAKEAEGSGNFSLARGLQEANLTTPSSEMTQGTGNVILDNLNEMITNPESSTLADVEWGSTLDLKSETEDPDALYGDIFEEDDGDETEDGENHDEFYSKKKV